MYRKNIIKNAKDTKDRIKLKFKNLTPRNIKQTDLNQNQIQICSEILEITKKLDKWINFWLIFHSLIPVIGWFALPITIFWKVRIKSFKRDLFTKGFSSCLNYNQFWNKSIIIAVFLRNYGILFFIRKIKLLSEELTQINN